MNDNTSPLGESHESLRSKKQSDVSERPTKAEPDIDLNGGDLPVLTDGRVDFRGLRARDLLLTLYDHDYDGIYVTHDLDHRTQFYDRQPDNKKKKDISKAPLDPPEVQWNTPKTREQVTNWQKSYGNSGVGLLSGISNLAGTYLGFIDADTDDPVLASFLKPAFVALLESLGVVVIRYGKRDENGNAHRFTIAFLSSEPIVTSTITLCSSDGECCDIQILGVNRSGNGCGCIVFDHYGMSDYEYTYEDKSFLDVPRTELPNVGNWRNLSSIIDTALKELPAGWKVDSSTLEKNNSGRPHAGKIAYRPIEDSDTLSLADAGPRWHPDNLTTDDVIEILNGYDPVERTTWLQNVFKVYDWCSGEEWGYELLVEYSIVEDTNPFDGSTCEDPRSKDYRYRYANREWVESGLIDAWNSCAAPGSEGNLTFGEDVKHLNSIRKPKLSLQLLSSFSHRLDDAIDHRSEDIFNEIATEIRNSNDLQDHHRGQLTTKYIDSHKASGLGVLQRPDVKGLLKPEEPKDMGTTNYLVNRYKDNSWNDQNGIPHISFESQQKKSSLPAYSSDVAEVFSVEVFETTGKVPSAHDIRSTQVVLAGYAKRAPQRMIYNRSATDSNGDVILDKGNGDGGVYRLSTEHGLINGTSTELEFRHTKTMKPYPEIDDIPSDQLESAIEDLQLLDKYIPSIKKYRTLFISSCIQILIPGTPNVGMMFFGEAGSGKTFTATIPKSLVDPTVNPKTIMPDSSGDLALLLFSEKLPVIDDFTDPISNKRQSILNAAITLSSTKMRLLYTTTEMANVALDAGFAFTSLGITGMRADFLSRLVTFFLPPMAKGTRRTQKEIDKQFEIDYPRIFRAMLALMIKALRIAPTMPVGDLRLSDQVQFGEAIHVALGDPRSFEELLRENQLAAALTQMDSLPFIEELIALVHARGEPFQKRSHELLIAVNRFNCNRMGGYGFTHTRKWPGSSEAVGKLLNANLESLSQRGVDVKPPTSTGHRAYTFSLNANRDEWSGIGNDPHAGEICDFPDIDIPTPENGALSECELTEEEEALINAELQKLGPSPSDDVFFSEYGRLLNAVRFSDNVIPFGRRTG